MKYFLTNRINYFLKIALILGLTLFSNFLMAESNQTLTLSKPYLYSCDRKVEKYKEIYKNIKLSDRYELLGSLKTDLNKDGSEDFIGIVAYSPFSKNQKCVVSEFDTAYGFVISLSKNNQNIVWYSEKLLNNLDFSKFNKLEKTENGFEIFFEMGHSYTAQLTVTFAVNGQSAVLDKIEFYDPQSQMDFDSRTIKYYRELPEHNIKEVSIKDRLSDDF